MSWPELHETLLGLVAALEPPRDTSLRVEVAEIDVPLEVLTTTGPDGPVIFARAPHSRWTSGFLTPTHGGRLVIAPMRAAEWP